MNDNPFSNSLIPDPLTPKQPTPDPSTPNLLGSYQVPSPLTPDQINQFSVEVSLNSSQIIINQEIANQSAEVWVEKKTNFFIQTLAKVDKGFDNTIISILGSITDDIK